MSRRRPGIARDERPVQLDEGSFHVLVGYPVVKMDDAFVVHGPQTTKAASLPSAHRHTIRVPVSVCEEIKNTGQPLRHEMTMSTDELGELVQLLENHVTEIDVDYLSMDNPPLYRTLRQIRKTTDRLRREYEWWKKEK